MVARLAGKNAIVTGAAGGVGLETAILMLQEGASVLLTDVNEAALQKALAKVQELVPKHDGQVATRVVDVSNEADVEAAVAAVDGWGGVDVMFNNAGIMHPKDGDAEECPDNIWDLTMNINVKGVWYGSKHAVRSLRKHKKTKGSIINTASKGAVLALTRELAVVHAREGYRFNSLCPAPLNTPMLQEFLGDDQAKRFRREVHFPSGRFGEAIEQAWAAVFLASDESSFVNATDFVVDGGLTKAYVTPEGPAIAAPKNQGR
ncbi:short-chain dehydrogenase/reductase [Microdochium trichocladiopsis]|uniref:Short-chain dehydrogenase/reductase n=1 Tax=Microdochium trichocladiopsis TaxID=1682393 RepID=A0A9P9BVH0_9PEZI|nr:short-chain dehydrogenase/reductase [Microdochium trichocladiopsis]KAH7039555.1 short-chain dehydrogenase/reductase [Microdochium trichocladiopsis]